MKANADYQGWLGDIYLAVEKALDCPTSDAQGVVDGQMFVLNRQWALGSTAEDAAAAVVKAATQSS